MIFGLLLSLLVAAQSPAPAPDASAVDGGPWATIDGVLLVINEDLLTRSRLGQAYQQAARDRNPRTPEDRARIWNEVYNASIRERLEVQSGKAMGFDDAQIDRFVRDDFDHFTRTRGGVIEFAKDLERDGITAEQFKELRRDGIYSELWENSVTGRGVSAKARPSRDRYVRPGRVRFEYELLLEAPGLMKTIGGSEGEIRVQQLVLDTSAFETLERAHDLAIQLRRRIVDGEDMTALVRQYSVPTPNDGIVVAESPSSLARAVPAAREFLLASKPGETSDPFLLESGKDRGYVLLRVLDRKAPEVPKLSDPGVQARIATRLQKQIDEYRVKTALDRTVAASYIWRAEPPKTQ